MNQLKLFKDIELPLINYLVVTQGFSGYKETGCATTEEVNKALRGCSFGALIQVSSPVGLDVSEFIPY